MDVRSYAKSAYLADPNSNKAIALSDGTWKDMNMDSVFSRIDSCGSLAGEERLYAMLREPFCDGKELSKRDQLIRYFDGHDELCRDYRSRLSMIGGDLSQPASVTLEKLSEIKPQSNAGHIICALLGLFSIAMIFIAPTAGLLIFLAVLILNISTYFKRKGEIGEYLSCFSYLVRSYRAARAMLQVSDDEDMEYRRKLRYAVDVLRGVVRGSFLITGGRGLTGGLINMLLDYLRMFFHLDLMKFNSMQKSVLEHRSGIGQLFYVIGEIDAYIAVSEYRRSLPFWCVPEYTGGDGSVSFKASGLCHPLLKDPVSSDIEAGAKGVLITGSNASGKSTFLRSAALAAILGQSIATVYAKSYKAPRFRITSSMTVSDDIVSGNSYYMAEIKALKDVIDLCDGGETVLCFIDEVLKGTNTIERVAASSEILKSLVRDNVLCFAATHDIELTKMLEDHFDNYHFEEDIRDNDVRFSYKLMKGGARSRNAIKLLNIMGYSDRITDAARERAEEFEKTGIWQKL